MSARAGSILHLLPEPWLAPVFSVAIALSGLLLVLGRRRAAAALFLLPISATLVGLFVTTLLSDLFAALPPDLVQPVSQLLFIALVMLTLGSALALVVGKQACEAAKGQLLADMIRAIFGSMFRNPLRWVLAGAVLWVIGMSATEARVISAARRAAAHATKPGQAKAGVAPPAVHVTALCGPARPCPLPEHVGATFVGGRYRETILLKDTRFHRVQAQPHAPFGDPSSPWTYWSRSLETGLQAIINRAVPTSRNGNTAGHNVTITLPRGTRVFEGTAASLPRGPVGGGNQVVIHRAEIVRLQQPSSQTLRRKP